MIKILVVDDEVRIRELLHKALVKKGYHVVTVPNAEQALACITQESFGLVLLDIRLTGESGISVLKKNPGVKKSCDLAIWGRTKQNAFILVCYLEKQGVLGP